MRLEDLQPGASVRGLLPEAAVTVVSVQWHGANALILVYRDPTGKVAEQLLLRDDEPRLSLVAQGRPWSFDGDGAAFRLAAEAHRIRLAYLFDPLLAVHTSLIEPLPHQISAVYECMLPRQPLRFLLADDPGAGKTIMAGLLIKELIARGDLKRCLIVCPGSLAEQWQDELQRRFHLSFEILTSDQLAAARTGNWFLEHDRVIARLDKLARDQEVQRLLRAPGNRYDLVICDEAHKLSATYFGDEIKYTQRYHLGRLADRPPLPESAGDPRGRRLVPRGDDREAGGAAPPARRRPPLPEAAGDRLAVGAHRAEPRPRFCLGAADLRATVPSPAAPLPWQRCARPPGVGRDASRIAEEIIAHLTSLDGASVTVTLEIAAQLPPGADEHLVRVITENCRALRFTTHGFERE